MGTFDDMGVYEFLGVPRSINAVGTGTVVGGSGPPEFVREKIEEASHGFVDMGLLLEKSGEFVARLLDVEGAFITSGGAAGLTMSAAACMAGTDPEKISQLPDTTGIKDEVIVQKKRMRSYDRCIRAAGAKLVEVGDDDSCTIPQVEAAIGPNTAAIYYPAPAYGAESGLTDWAPPPGDPNLVSLDDMAGIGKAAGVPVFVDGADKIYPLELFRKVAGVADLAAFGGKYYGGPNASGIVFGRKDMVEAVAAQSFIPTVGGLGVGRSMKSDRQQIVATVVALDAWFNMNHEERIQTYDTRAHTIAKGLEGIPGLDPQLTWRSDTYYGSFVTLKLDTDTLGKTAAEISDELLYGEPSILMRAPAEDTMWVWVYTLLDGEDQMIVDRLREVLA